MQAAGTLDGITVKHHGAPKGFACAWDDSIFAQETRRQADFGLLVENEEATESAVDEDEDGACDDHGSILCLTQLMMCAAPITSTGRHQRTEAYELPSEQVQPLRI